MLSLIFATILALAVLTSCAGMSRSDKSGYLGRDLDQNQSRDRRASEREATMSDMGLGASRELSDRELDSVNTRVVLGKAEKALEGKREREQYFKNKPYMKNDRDRLEFLQLGSFESRARWLNAKGVQASMTQHAPDVQALVDINDVALGMTKQAVKDSWGEPDLVEVAGNPIYGNERWHYSEQTSSTEGYRSQHRLVYFESGRVVGWESR
jgi:outer membrane protein assembly factor BamE (lipoprotein component of BamABCDE complex)